MNFSWSILCIRLYKDSVPTATTSAAQRCIECSIYTSRVAEKYVYNIHILCHHRYHHLHGLSWELKTMSLHCWSICDLAPKQYFWSVLNVLRYTNTYVPLVCLLLLSCKCTLFAFITKRVFGKHLFSDTLRTLESMPNMLCTTHTRSVFVLCACILEWRIAVYTYTHIHTAKRYTVYRHQITSKPKQCGL